MTKNFIFLNKKWVVLPIYAIGMFVLWLCRGHIYSYFSVTSQTIELVYNALFLIVVFAGLVALIQTLRCPPFMKRRVQTAFKRTALHNKMGEYPVLKSVYIDKDIPHCKILRIKNVGISVGEFEIWAAALEAGLSGKIKGISYSARSNSIILLYLIPKKYIAPLAISLDSKALAQEPWLLGRLGAARATHYLFCSGYMRHIPMRV